MEKFHVRWTKIQNELVKVREECVEYLTNTLKQDKYKEGIFPTTEDGETVCVTYDGGRHPEYDANPYSIVNRVYAEDAEIYLDTEDCTEYNIDRIDTDELVWLCMFIADNIVSTD